MKNSHNKSSYVLFCPHSSSKICNYWSLKSEDKLKLKYLDLKDLTQHILFDYNLNVVIMDSFSVD